MKCTPMSSLLAVILGSSAALLSSAAASYSSGPGFDWLSLQPLWHLQYTQCYDGFECARIHMPLDWLNLTDTRTVTLAVLKVPATVPASDPRHGGTVIVNPGGPGDSGVVHMLKNGRYIQSMLDSPGRRFDVLSFDTRGVALSTPRADCYTSEAARRAAEWQARGARPLDGLDMAALKRALARTTAHGLQCAGYREEGIAFNMHEYTATASVARDMLRLVDETEVLRRRAAMPDVLDAMESGMQQPLGGGGEGVDDVDDHDAGADGHDAGRTPRPRLQYYGTSYGTVLGNAFLSMFPGRVKRMILDGVVVADNWVLGDWEESAVDTHHAINYFYKTCFQAGTRCALRNDSDSSWHSIQQRVDALVARLDEDPVPGATVDGPEVVIDGSDILDLMFGQLYSPLDFFDSLSSTLAQAVRGNYTQLLAELVPPMSDNDAMYDIDRNNASNDTDSAVDAILRAYTWMAETFSSVACGDTPNLGHYPLSHWQHKLQKLHERYPRLGVLIAEQTLKCAGWQSHPKDRFAGPFRSPSPPPVPDSHDDDENDSRPSAPLLLLSTLYDPITPLDSARAVARSHPQSRVLVQNSVGHCTLLASPSRCTRRVMQAYMANGTMPNEGLICEGDCVPFKECNMERGRFPR
ncbi:hypothetical protein E4U27_003196 [Claviceps purpurea]|nr:hypothetical protein E4U27_003196 [Claviceps purpurea]KAG6225487.1 hypothetical protein E4U26_003011 [Claviceps purpurea]